MSTPTTVTGFVAVLAATFGITLGVGNAVGLLSEPATSQTAAHGADHDAGITAPVVDGEGDTPGGPMVSQNGYTLSLADQQAGPGSGVAFTVSGPDGQSVTAYDVEHEKRLHLIGVRGDYEPATAPSDSRTATVDGYTVTLDGDLEPGADAELTLSVAREPVTDLEPYLGAYGHLVALRGGDLAYLHVHADGTGDDSTQPGPDVVFYAAVSSTGAYRLYLDFKHGGEVRTAAFTVTADGTAAPVTEARSPRRPTPAATTTAAPATERSATSRYPRRSR